jgi:HNH endonuclease
VDRFASLFRGKTSLHLALRDAGKADAPPLRNVRWITAADDGVSIVNVWKHSLDVQGNDIIATVGLKRRREASSHRRIKHEEVIGGLAAAIGGTVRVILLDEKVEGSGVAYGAKYDDLLWSVSDAGHAFILRRGGHALPGYVPVPATPEEYGTLAPQYREHISKRIERLARVGAVTLERAAYSCELPGCEDAADFTTPDVHHIVELGAGGSDHTDNTIALCPACHVRVHRGTDRVRAMMKRAISRVRNGRDRSA